MDIVQVEEVDSEQDILIQAELQASHGAGISKAAMLKTVKAIGKNRKIYKKEPNYFYINGRGKRVDLDRGQIQKMIFDGVMEYQPHYGCYTLMELPAMLRYESF